MNWNEMSPRERDALVAEKVMGWKRYAAVSRGNRVVVIAEKLGDCWHIHSRSQRDPGTWEATDDPLTETWNLKRYTTSISAAWEVVEKMREEGLLFEIGSRVSEGWYAMTMHADYRSCPECDGPYDLPYWHAPTAPEAICLAALRAKGVEV